ncbi:hypothetical protein QU481_06265 [Crenobacter sp. SG2303]|uniref:Uncharacterized protein n=1 Tax=Crenobacter oryzisoli TaxID=3056844 RepID=A0ABT7XL41_9NEIS|nr:hypothetical protein [Crenobacter sp. SG2303]MDN0074500.1 hypothetical protein [Crenobacter sp. SG2303]
MSSKFLQRGALLLTLLCPLLAKADDWLGQYALVPNERMQQMYDENGEPAAMLTVVKLADGYGLVSKNLGWSEPKPAQLEKDGQALRDWLGSDAKGVKSQALVAPGMALIRVAKGSTLEARNGRSHQMRSDYLFVVQALGVDLELEKNRRNHDCRLVHPEVPFSGDDSRVVAGRFLTCTSWNFTKINSNTFDFPHKKAAYEASIFYFAIEHTTSYGLFFPSNRRGIPSQ